MNLNQLEYIDFCFKSNLVLIYDTGLSDFLSELCEKLKIYKGTFIKVTFGSTHYERPFGYWFIYYCISFVLF